MPAVVEDNSTNNNPNSTDKNDNEDEEKLAPKMSYNDLLRASLKRHILYERARKKQQREIEVQEERQRKEREAKEQEELMTLEETREQIKQLEGRLLELKEEKHELFGQLKKVLHEDDNRRKHLVKETTEQILQIQAIPQGLMPHQPQTLYIQQAQPSSRIQAIAQQVAQQAPPGGYKTTIKRPRSPSPPTQVPVTMFHQGYTTYKPPTLSAAPYQGSPQKDDGRRNELVRAVLWNKAPQYSSQPSAFYPVAPQEIPIYYSPLPRETVRPVYETPRQQTFQVDHKLQEHYTTLRTAASGHVIHPGSGLTINPAQAVSKGGSITAGYPVRSQTQYQQAAPASLYTTQSRQMYQNYPQRD